MANTDSQKGKTLSGLLKEKFDTQIAGKPVDWPLRKSYKKRFVCFGWNTL